MACTPWMRVHPYEKPSYRTLCRALIDRQRTRERESRRKKEGARVTAVEKAWGRESDHLLSLSNVFKERLHDALYLNERARESQTPLSMLCSIERCTLGSALIAGRILRWQSFRFAWTLCPRLDLLSGMDASSLSAHSHGDCGADRVKGRLTRAYSKSNP